MNEKIEKNPIYLPPFKRFCMTIGELPTSYVETMSYYEMILWFTKYLGDTVIPAIDNNAEALKEVQNLFLELQDYVNSYFDDLNVQTEINNKLDEMADAGELSTIISLFLNSACIIAFDTISDMADAENLVAGSYTKTFGKSSNDGIGFFYKVRAKVEGDSPDGLGLVQLHDSNLVAERIVEYMISDTTNPIYYGADPTGTTNSATAINNCIQANKGGVVNFSSGTYLVNNTIILPYKLDEKVSINGNGATIINTDDLTRLIYVGGDKGSLTANDVGFVSYIKDLNIISDDSNTTYCIDVVNGFKDLKLYNLRIYRFLNGLRIGESNTSPADVLITDSLLYGKGSEYDGVGIISNCTDNNADMCRIYGYRKGFIINGSINITKCHILLRWENQTSANFDPYVRNGVEWNEYYPLTMFAEVNTTTRIIDCYCDSMYKFLKITVADVITLTNSWYLNSRDNVNCEIIEITRGDSKLQLSNNTFYLSKNNYCRVIKNNEKFNNYGDIGLNNNIIRNLSKITSISDPILSNVTSRHNAINMIANTWYIIACISNISPNERISINTYINQYEYFLQMQINESGDISAIYQFNKANTNSAWTLGCFVENDTLFICLKNNNNANGIHIDSKVNNSYNPSFKTVPINTNNSTDSSRLLSDYTETTPTVTLLLKEVE